LKISSAQHARLTFLCRITQKEIQHLLGTDHRLFADQAWRMQAKK
jgi:hypothetical protein